MNFCAIQTKLGLEISGLARKNEQLHGNGSAG